MNTVENKKRFDKLSNIQIPYQEYGLSNSGFRKLDLNMKFISATQGLEEKGNIAWEYNPFYNYRMNYDLYKFDELGRLLYQDGTQYKLVPPITYMNRSVTPSKPNTIVFTINNIYDIIKSNLIYLENRIEISPGMFQSDFPDFTRALDSDEITEILNGYPSSRYGVGKQPGLLGQLMNPTVIPPSLSNPILGPNKLKVVARSGALLDMDTNQLNFSLLNPVEIECQEAFDGSINLILNDNLNPPRLINSRFISTGLNTYKVANRRNNNDTNIYDDDSFDIDTSLYKKITSIPDLKFGGLLSGGNVKCGNYTFYFKYCDPDGNETDFVTESGQVVCHIGNINDPKSARAGIRDENSNKMIWFQLSNIDTSYDFVTVYFTRKYSDIDGIPVIDSAKIDKQYKVVDKESKIIYTGFEQLIDISIEDINVEYNVVTAVETQAQVQNMLLMGNVNKPEIPYEELTDLSLRIYPVPFIKGDIGNVNEDYVDSTGKYEYYNVKNIYERLSYWDKEIYRFGIVYILNDYTLSPVFNTRGGNNIGFWDGTQPFPYTTFPVYDEDNTNWRTGEKKRNYIEFDTTGNKISLSDHPESIENVRGVVRFNIDDENKYIYDGTRTTPLGVRFHIPEDVIIELSKYIKGYFLVRQKRIPTVLCQAMMIGLDRNCYLPLVPNFEGDFVTERFINDKLALDSSFKNHSYAQSKEDVEIKAAICPEAELRQSLFNQLFTGSEFIVQESKVQPQTGLKGFSQSSLLEGRSFYVGTYDILGNKTKDYVPHTKITLVNDDTSIITSGTQFFSARAGNASEAWRYSWLKKDSKWNQKEYDGRMVVEKLVDWVVGLFNKNKRKEKQEPKKPNNMVRGIYGSYIGVEGFEYPFRIINIYIPGYDTSMMEEYFDVRYSDKSPYSPIMHRTEFTKSELYHTVKEKSKTNTTSKKYYQYEKYGGDTYICNYTHRMQRNFEDPEVKINTEIIDEETFEKNYKPYDVEGNNKINRADVNAVQIGHWVTFKLLSNVNLSFRDVDKSIPGEQALFGNPRGFYPLYGKTPSGAYKIPESRILNGGISSSTGDKWYFELPNVPYIKQEFQNRIMYSDIHITDAFKNGYRTFRMGASKDYTKEHGQIMKMIEWFGSLLVIFEHGVGLIPINERVQAGEGPGGNVFINTSKVLPENPRMLSVNYGTQWKNSIIVTPNYCYGVDTVGKKIWRTNGEQFELISDFKIQQFLNQNITLDERETHPILGIRDVKSHYNAFKQDVMFTFYDNTYGLEETVWNVCWNELQNSWVTFYSWVPGSSENIDNIYFSFDRNSIKWVSKLGKSNSQSTYSEGICIENVIFNSPNNSSNPNNIKVHDGVVWINPTIANSYVNSDRIIGKLEIRSRNLPEVPGKSKVVVKYELLEDPFGSHLGFELLPYMENIQVGYHPNNTEKHELRETGAYLVFNKDFEKYEYFEPTSDDPEYEYRKKVYQLNIRADVQTIIFDNTDQSMKQYSEGFKSYMELNSGFFVNSIAVTSYVNIGKWQKAEIGLFNVATNSLIQSEIFLSNTIELQEELERRNDQLGSPETRTTEWRQTKWWPGLTTDFWKHGQAGLMDIVDEIKPTYWYGRQHPFEFEFVVVDNPGMQKIFNNLYIISNKAEPESFHYEIVGEGYNFSKDKRNIFYRQELLKEFFQKALYKDIIYNRKFRKIISLIQNAISYFFPLYYNRITTFDEIYHSYQNMTSLGKSYENLTGTEIVWDELLNEFKLVSHQKANSIDKVVTNSITGEKKPIGRLRGNMQYKEDIWNVEIRPINFTQMNEPKSNVGWINQIKLWWSHIPNIFHNDPELPIKFNPNIFDGNTYKPNDTGKIEQHHVEQLPKDLKRIETRIRDKYLKIKVRYSGEDLAVIFALKTIFTHSHA